MSSQQTWWYDNDDPDSDDPELQAALELSRETAQSDALARLSPAESQPRPGPESNGVGHRFKPHGSGSTYSSTLNSSSKRISHPLARPHTQHTVQPPPKSLSTSEKAGSYALNRLRAEYRELGAEVSLLDAQIRELTEQRGRSTRRMEEISRQLGSSGLETRPREVVIIEDESEDDGKAAQVIDYSKSDFPWTTSLEVRMESVFGIKDFRLCQRGVCNANMDGRDIVCIMPTGGGKSLTFQLPALLTSGVTLVVSPLISLMTDQILHLKEKNVHAAMINSATPKSEKDRIMAELRKWQNDSSSSEGGLKLLYVTPEKLAKDMAFKSVLQKIDEKKKFDRIVIDEAHCVSQLGHDFRPDYSKLRELRKLYPRVPIMALSATCGPAVLTDLLKILGLRKVVAGTAANHYDTVYFSSPLYRKNLHYTVKPKSEKAAEHLEVIKDYILEKHPNDTGIIYCFTVKDTEVVAQKLRELSNGRIKTGVYHANVADKVKHQLHEDWRRGSIKVVCATIAFGLGIDKGDVRFVIHHSMSKSLEGFYQESGRAGRDGQDSDCVLYYRPQDFSHLASMTASENQGQEKLHAMIDFAENLETCRKIQFAQYFSHSAQTSLSSWSTSDQDALEPCGHCDNCLRVDSGTLIKRDVTFEVWQILQIVDLMREEGGRVTLGLLANFARGTKGGKAKTFEVASGKGKRKARSGKAELDLGKVGGPVELSRVDIEHLVARLLPMGYLTEEYVVNAYGSIAYLKTQRTSLLRLTMDQVKAGAHAKIEMCFVEKSKAKSKKGTKVASKGKSKAKAGEDVTNYFGSQKTKAQGAGNSDESDPITFLDSDSDDMYEGDDGQDPADPCADLDIPIDHNNNDDDELPRPVKKKQRQEIKAKQFTVATRWSGEEPLELTSDSDGDSQSPKWTHSYRNSASTPAASSSRKPPKRRFIPPPQEVVELSD